jgi:hypothetical protein
MPSRLVAIETPRLAGARNRSCRMDEPVAEIVPDTPPTSLAALGLLIGLDILRHTAETSGLGGVLTSPGRHCGRQRSIRSR